MSYGDQWAACGNQFSSTHTGPGESNSGHQAEWYMPLSSQQSWRFSSIDLRGCVLFPMYLEKPYHKLMTFAGKVSFLISLRGYAFISSEQIPRII